jgi:hypothetical protein
MALVASHGGDAAFDQVVLPATTRPVAPDLHYAPAASIDEKLLLELAASIENKGAFLSD